MACSEQSTRHVCGECGKKFKDSWHLQRHVSSVHCDFPRKKGRKFNCLQCEQQFTLEAELQSHYKEIHNINYEIELHEFLSIEEFKIWKASIEKESTSNFIKVNGDRRDSSGKIHQRWKCHRGGQYKPLLTQRKRQLKIKGTIKIGTQCTAGLNVTIDVNGKTSVLYSKTHIGHEPDLEKLHLTEMDRQSLAAKLAAKIPMNEILNEIADSAAGDHLERVHLSTRRDLRNIAASFHLDISDGVRHADNSNLPISKLNNIICLREELLLKVKNVLNQCQSVHELNVVEKALNLDSLMPIMLATRAKETI